MAMAKVYIQFILMIIAFIQLANSMRLMPYEDTEKRNFVSSLLHSLTFFILRRIHVLLKQVF